MIKITKQTKDLINIKTTWYKTSELSRRPSKDLRKGKSYYFGFIKIIGSEKKLFHIYADNKLELKQKLEKKYKAKRK